MPELEIAFDLESQNGTAKSDAQNSFDLCVESFGESVCTSCKLVVVRRSNLNVQGQAQLVEACANEEVLNILIVRTSIFDSTSSSFLSRG